MTRATDQTKPDPPPVCPVCHTSATKQQGGHVVCIECGYVYK